MNNQYLYGSIQSVKGMKKGLHPLGGIKIFFIGYLFVDRF